MYFILGENLPEDLRNIANKIVMRIAACTVSSDLKIFFEPGSLLPFLFPSIINSSWMTLSVYMLYTTFLIGLL